MTMSGRPLPSTSRTTVAAPAPKMPRATSSGRPVGFAYTSRYRSPATTMSGRRSPFRSPTPTASTTWPNPHEGTRCLTNDGTGAAMDAAEPADVRAGARAGARPTRPAAASATAETIGVRCRHTSCRERTVRAASYSFGTGAVYAPRAGRREGSVRLTCLAEGPTVAGPTWMVSGTPEGQFSTCRERL